MKRKWIKSLNIALMICLPVGLAAFKCSGDKEEKDEEGEITTPFNDDTAAGVKGDGDMPTGTADYLQSDDTTYEEEMKLKDSEPSKANQKGEEEKPMQDDD